MTVLVTGGCGYIGSHIVWALRDLGEEVLILDDFSTGCRENVPPEIPIIAGDVGDAELLRSTFQRAQISAVIHLAGKILPAESIRVPLDYYASNVGKTIALVDAMMGAGISQLIFSSTAAVYGQSEAGLVTEAAPTNPLSPYGASKLMAERIIGDACRTQQLHAIALRYFNVAGADPLGRCGPRGTNPGHLLRTAVDVALGRRPYLEIFGADYNTPDGTCVRDYVHVSDIAEAHLSALAYLRRTSGFTILNCGYGRGASVREAINATEMQLGRPLPVRVIDRRPGDPPMLIADSSLLRSLTGWCPRQDDLGNIIATMLSWEDSHSPQPSD